MFVLRFKIQMHVITKKQKIKCMATLRNITLICCVYTEEQEYEDATILIIRHMEYKKLGMTAAIAKVIYNL